jgi:hypothetical protein
VLPWSVVDLLIQRHALRKQQHHHRVEQRLHRVRVAPLILASISAVLPYSFFSPTNHQSALVEQQLPPPPCGPCSLLLARISAV